MNSFTHCSTMLGPKKLHSPPSLFSHAVDVLSFEQKKILSLITIVGSVLGCCDGEEEGEPTGCLVGYMEGCDDGVVDGCSDGIIDGFELGHPLGTELGCIEGTMDGEEEGWLVG
jgi:hypothetical protein